METNSTIQNTEKSVGWQRSEVQRDCKSVCNCSKSLKETADYGLDYVECLNPDCCVCICCLYLLFLLWCSLGCSLWCQDWRMGCNRTVMFSVHHWCDSALCVCYDVPKLLCATSLQLSCASHAIELKERLLSDSECMHVKRSRTHCLITVFDYWCASLF